MLILRYIQLQIMHYINNIMFNAGVAVSPIDVSISKQVSNALNALQITFI